MTPELLELISDMRFPLLGVVLIGFIKTELVNLINGISFRYDKDFNECDPIILKGRKARIIKIGLFKTKIIMEDNFTMRKFNNFDIDRIEMEKILIKHEVEK